MKTRELRRMLSDAGCHFVRRAGSHEIWRTAGGVTLPPFRHGHDDVSVGVRASVLRSLRGS